MKLQLLLFLAFLSIFLLSLEVDGRKSLLQKEDGKDSKLVKQTTILDADFQGEMVANHQMKKPTDLEDPGDEEGGSSEDDEDEEGSRDGVPGDDEGESEDTPSEDEGDFGDNEGGDSGEGVPGDDEGEFGGDDGGGDVVDVDDGDKGDDGDENNDDNSDDGEQNDAVNVKKVGN